jgi:hypothetical protein
MPEWKRFSQKSRSWISQWDFIFEGKSMKLVFKKGISENKTWERRTILFEAGTQRQVTEGNKTWVRDIFVRDSINELVPSL